MRNRKLKTLTWALVVAGLGMQQAFGGYLVRSFFDEFGLGLPTDADGIDPVVNAIDFDRELGGAFPEELRQGFTNIQDGINSDDGIDNFGSLTRGYVQAPMDGEFWILVATDDDSELYMNTSENSHEVFPLRDPAHLIGQETGWTAGDAFTAARLDERGSRVTMEKGKIYYTELLHREGGGGSFVSVHWERPDGVREVIPAGSLIPFGNPGDTTFAPATALAISEQPLDQNVGESQSATFAVCAHGPQPLSFQWLKGGQPIDGAITQAYHIPEAQLADDGAVYSVRVTAPNGQTSTSGSATLSVAPDTAAPTVVSVSPSGQPHGFIVEFSEKVTEATATSQSNYSIGGQSIAINGIRMLSDTSVVIETGDFNTDATTLTVSGIKDRSSRGNTLASTTLDVVYSLQGAIYLFYEGNIFNSYAEADRGKGRFPDGFNDFDPEVQGLQDLFDRRASSSTPYLEIPNTGDIDTPPNGNVQDQYSTVVFGFIVPKETANYHFFLAVDDNSRLYLSTDENPENTVEIAREPQWNGVRQWTGTDGDVNQSPTSNPNGFRLEAGNRYYFETMSQEGGGGDNFAVAWNTTGTPPDNGDGSQMITSEFLQSSVEAGPLEFVKQPTAKRVTQGFPVTFTSEISGSDRLLHQFIWYKNGEPIPGATAPTLTLDNPKIGDNGAEIHIEAFNSNGTFNRLVSGPAVLTVIDDTEHPAVVSAAGTPLKDTVFLNFDEDVVEASVQNTSAYAITGDDGSTLAVTAVSVNGPREVQLTTAEQGEGVKYNVQISGIEDSVGNRGDRLTSFTSFMLASGGLTALFYEAPGTSLDFYPEPRGINQVPENFNPFGNQDLAQGTIPSIQRRESHVAPYFETPSTGNIDNAPPSSIVDNYAVVMFGWIQPEVTGTYRFFLAADDNAELYLSTDENPANSRRLGVEDNWVGVRVFINREEKDRQLFDGDVGTTSDPIDLTAGERYYVEAMFSEGGGGDNLAVGWTSTTDGSDPPELANGSNPIPGNVLWSQVPPPVLTIDATLESASSVTGPWSPVSGAGDGTATVPVGGAAQFFRLNGSDASLSIDVGGGNATVTW